MTEYDILCSILNNKFLSKSQNVMIESKGNQKPHEVKVDGTGRTGLLWSLYRFDMDECNFLPFFANHDDAPKGLCKFCDYILVAETGLKTYVMLIELKRGKDGANAERQLYASEIFMKYIFSTANRLYQDFDSDSFNTDDVIIRKIKIRKNVSAKTTIKMPKVDLKQNYIQYDSASLFPIAKFC